MLQKTTIPQLGHGLSAATAAHVDSKGMRNGGTVRYALESKRRVFQRLTWECQNDTGVEKIENMPRHCGIR